MKLTVVPEKQQDEGVVARLKRLLAEIEDGEISVETFYFVAFGDKRALPNGGVSEPATVAFDSGLTIEQAVTLLEREKFRILCAADGVAHR